MTKPNHAELLTLRDLFRAYAGTTERSEWKKVAAYRAKRLQLLEGLFGAAISDAGSYDDYDHYWIVALAARWLEHRSADPFQGSFILGGPTPEDELVRDYLPLLGGAVNRLRELYEEMAEIVLARTFPAAAHRTVGAGRLSELGLPLNEPTDCGETIKHLVTGGRYARAEVETFDRENAARPDSVTEEEMDRLKESEEAALRAERQRAQDRATVIERAVAAGLGDAAAAPGRIYNLSPAQFLDLARDMPHLSRVDFKPLA
ncbi:MAG: hypothetical protein PHC88_04430 [Terrimicrobiaceae bacterium]|nr:hypothetical protein [Terrimicrobiaceae bacterium]